MAEPPTEPIDKRTLRVFKAGNLFEQFVKELIIKDGGGWIDCGREPIECEDVKGFADLLCENEVADVKSQHSRSFWWMVKSADIKKDKYCNWLQVMYYTRELKKDFGRLVFVSKDDLCIQEYVQQLDAYWLGELSDELQRLRYYWNKQELPPAEPRAFGGKENTVKTPKKSPFYGYPKECSYCAYFTKCKKVEETNEVQD
jgi:hypothetical protein